jgi:hypothetical protein
MAGADDIVVEVIVWDGSKETDNPYGHVTTKIIKNGIPYSYSLEDDPNPHVVCNTEAFNLLEKHEQRLRSGFGFILNVTPQQARDIFMSMQVRFHSYNTKSCIYHKAWHNCTYAIQESIQKSGIDLYKVNDGRTLFPSKFEYGLLKIKNNNGWLVKKIIGYKKGDDKGIDINTDKAELLFNVHAVLDKDGWHANDIKPDYSENW